MKYQEQHEAFKKLAIQQGICKIEQLNQALPFGCSVSPTRVDRWLNRLLELPDSFSCQRRYVNRFKLGADPEFVFGAGGVRMDARLLGLQQGLAFGMDNNGRLTEIRPYPSRSALEVTASILTTLRWLAILFPASLKYEWLAGAFIMGDGLGGHVHFGRKRPGRDLEVKALDTIEDELLYVKAYPAAEVARRRQGDGHNQHYGLPGDIRKQLHGYEYRTFPSWLDSPELAFLSITLSKLVVQNPGLAQGYVPLPSLDRHYQRIRNLLSYYKDVDDDARLALSMVARRLPVHIGGDFKKRWGIESAFLARPDVAFIPSSIKPTVEDVAELFAYLFKMQPLANRIPTPTWSPLAPPADYEMLINKSTTFGAKGLGELIWDICAPKALHLGMINTRELPKGVFFSLPAPLARILPLGWERFCDHKIVQHKGDDSWIYSNEKNREPSKFVEGRRLLLETALPFWRVGDVKPDSFQQWQSVLRKPSSKKKFDGELLYGDMGPNFREYR